MPTSPLAMVFDADTTLLDDRRPHDGVPEMLLALRAAGYPLGIATGRTRAAWDRLENELGLGPFVVVITADRGPETLSLALDSAAAALDLAPDSVLFVGASPAGAAAARSAGLRVAAALWPDPDRATSGAAEWRFARPADLTRTFAAWC